jgi:hypothetical protein
MVWTVAQYHHAAPDPASFDGTYYNSCCLPVRIANGRVRYGNAEAKLKLVDDKFGLEGWPDRPFGPFYFVDADRMEPAVFAFDGADRFSVADASGKELTFIRKGH